MSESAFKPPEQCEDELDELARSIRQELRAIGFAPAFDPGPEEIGRRRRQAAIERGRKALARFALSYLGPVLVVVAVGLALRIIVPGM